MFRSVCSDKRFTSVIIVVLTACVMPVHACGTTLYDDYRDARTRDYPLNNVVLNPIGSVTMLNQTTSLTEVFGTATTQDIFDAVRFVGLYFGVSDEEQQLAITMERRTEHPEDRTMMARSWLVGTHRGWVVLYDRAYEPTCGFGTIVQALLVLLGFGGSSWQSQVTPRQHFMGTTTLYYAKKLGIPPVLKVAHVHWEAAPPFERDLMATQSFVSATDPRVCVLTLAAVADSNPRLILLACVEDTDCNGTCVRVDGLPSRCRWNVSDASTPVGSQSQKNIMFATAMIASFIFVVLFVKCHHLNSDTDH
jgi:hypothetical protein